MGAFLLYDINSLELLVEDYEAMDHVCSYNCW